jgi:hypothetical protein
VLALLALVVFPVFAHAAAVPNYFTKPEETKLPRHKVNQPKPHEGHSPGTETHNPAQGSAAPEPGGSEETPERSESSPVSPAGNGHHGDGNGPGPSVGEPTTHVTDKIGPAEVVAVADTHRVPTASLNDYGAGGSSLVLPILIAVIVLATLSIAIAVYRQRRSGDGPHDRRGHPIGSSPGA